MTNVTPEVGFAANRQTILIDAAVAGLDIANLPNFMIEQHLASGKLVQVLTDWLLSPMEMTALWQKNRITARLV